MNHLGLLALTLLLAAPVAAQDREASCPEYFDYRDDVTALLERAELAGHETPWDAFFDLRPERAGWRLDLQFRIRGELWRETRRGVRCQPLMDEALEDLERHLRPRERFGVQVGLWADAGSAPQLTLAGQVGLTARYEWAGIILRAQYWLPSAGHAGSGATVEGLGLSIGLLLCGRPYDEREIGVDLCVGATGGGTSARIARETQWGPAVNLEAEAAVERRLTDYAALRLSATLLVPVLRPAFDFGLATGPLSVTGVVGARVGFAFVLEL